MQLQDYIDDVLEIVHDSTNSSWRLSRVISRINDARIDAARDMWCVRRNVTGVQLLQGKEIYELNGAVVGANVTSGGSNYGAGSTVAVTFAAPPPGGVQALGVGTLVSGALASITMTQWGQGYNAVCVQRGTYVAGGNILIVDGALTNISEGNRLRRLVIGFGTGASTLDSNVSMYQRVGGNLNQVLTFSTHADSGKMPGAAVMAPVGVAAGGGAAAIVATNAAVGGAKSYSSSTSSLAKKTSDQIVKTVTDYTARAGWRMQ